MNINIETPEKDKAIGFTSTPLNNGKLLRPPSVTDRGVTPILHYSEATPNKDDIKRDQVLPSRQGGGQATMPDSPKETPTQTIFSRVIASLYYIMTWLMPWKYFSHKGVSPQRSFQATPNPPSKPSFMRQCLNRVHKFTGCM